MIALSDHASQVIWCKNFLRSLIDEEVKAVVLQDNQATIASIVKGRPSQAKARHVDVKHFWLKQEVDKKVVSLEYRASGSMVADYLTKPLQGELFTKSRERLMGA